MSSVRAQDVSLWLDEALAAEAPGPAVAEALPRSADVVIVGGGFTGLWTAIRLLEADPGLEVCVLEARICGYGASGRNGGIAEGSWAKLPVMRRLYGDREAVGLARAIQDGLDELERFCAEHAIDCELRRRGQLWAASNQSQLGAWRAAVEAAGAVGEDARFREVAAEEARALGGSPQLLGGVVEEEAATVQPAKLVRGLRRVALERGARVLEGTSMLGFAGRDPVTVTTSRGDVRARKVVLATNAWAASRPELRPHLLVTSSDIVATERSGELPAPDGLRAGLALSDSRRLILYWRSTPDGRVVLGKGGGWVAVGNRVDRRFTGPTRLAGQVERRLRRLYPELSGLPVARSWNGPIDYSTTGLPYFGPLSARDPDVLVGVGYSGMGVVQTVLGGRILASLVLGRDDDHARSPLTRRWERRLPPEPLRTIGAPLVKAAITHRETLEDAEVRPGLLTRALAALDPTAAPTQS